MSSIYPAFKAEEKYGDVRRMAFIKDILSLVMRRRPSTLLPYESIRSHLNTAQERTRGTQLIRLDQIVGSVGRYRDFTREFLPRAGASRERWKRLDMAVNRLEDIPPIDVYKIGDVYFVKDGNHRVSVARANGFRDIEAVVTEISAKAPFTPDMDPAEFIARQEYAEFLERTHLDQLRPKASIGFSTVGRYEELLEHIDVHRYFMGLEQGREIPYDEAVTSWYDHVYRPVIELIRRDNILRYFPGRTEADLYVWLMDYLHELREEYGEEVSVEQAAADLVEQQGEKPLPEKVVQPLVNAASAIKEKVEDEVDKPLPHAVMQPLASAVHAIKETVEETVEGQGEKPLPRKMIQPLLEAARSLKDKVEELARDEQENDEKEQWES